MKYVLSDLDLMKAVVLPSSNEIQKAVAENNDTFTAYRDDQRQCCVVECTKPPRHLLAYGIKWQEVH